MSERKCNSIYMGIQCDGCFGHYLLPLSPHFQAVGLNVTTWTDEMVVLIGPQAPVEAPALAQPTTVVHVPTIGEIAAKHFPVDLYAGNTMAWTEQKGAQESCAEAIREYVEVLREQSQAAQPVASPTAEEIAAKQMCSCPEDDVDFWGSKRHRSPQCEIRVSQRIYDALAHIGIGEAFPLCFKELAAYRSAYAASLQARVAELTKEWEGQIANCAELKEMVEDAETRAEAAEARVAELRDANTTSLAERSCGVQDHDKSLEWESRAHEAERDRDLLNICADNYAADVAAVGKDLESVEAKLEAAEARVRTLEGKK